MVARTPIFNVFYLGFYLTLFFLLAAPVFFFHLPKFVVFVNLTGAMLLTRYFHLALGRHWRQRIKQRAIRRQALKSNKPFVFISRHYAQSDLFQTGVPLPTGRISYISLFEALLYDLSRCCAIVVLGDQDLDPNDPAARALFVSRWPDEAARRSRFVYDYQQRNFFSSLGKSWEDIFLFLASNAKLVLVIPAASEGVRREIELLREHKFASRAVVFMWPTGKGHPNPAITAPPRDWEEARRYLNDVGLRLPEHKGEGGLLHLNDDLTIRLRAPLPMMNFLSLTVATEKSHDFVALRDIAPHIRSIEIAANADRYGPMWS